MDSTYSVSSLAGFVSSKRRLHLPPNCSASPKFRQIDFVVPDVKVAVGFRGKTGMHFFDDAVLQIVDDDLFNKMRAFTGLSLHRSENAPFIYTDGSSLERREHRVLHTTNSAPVTAAHIPIFTRRREIVKFPLALREEFRSTEGEREIQKGAPHPLKKRETP